MALLKPRPMLDKMPRELEPSPFMNSGSSSCCTKARSIWNWYGAMMYSLGRRNGRGLRTRTARLTMPSLLTRSMDLTIPVDRRNANPPINVKVIIPSRHPTLTTQFRSEDASYAQRLLKASPPAVMKHDPAIRQEAVRIPACEGGL